MTFSLVSALRPFKIPLTLSYPFINHHAYTRDSHSKQHKESIPLQIAYTEYLPRQPQAPEESQPIIILHGLFGSKQNWKSLAKSFTQSLNTKVYAVVRQGEIRSWRLNRVNWLIGSLAFCRIWEIMEKAHILQFIHTNQWLVTSRSLSFNKNSIDQCL